MFASNDCSSTHVSWCVHHYVLLIMTKNILFSDIYIFFFFDYKLLLSYDYQRFCIFLNIKFPLFNEASCSYFGIASVIWSAFEPKLFWFLKKIFLVYCITFKVKSQSMNRVNISFEYSVAVFCHDKFMTWISKKNFTIFHIFSWVVPDF